MGCYQFRFRTVWLCVMLFVFCSSGQTTGSVTESPGKLLSPTPVDVPESPPVPTDGTILSDSTKEVVNYVTELPSQSSFIASYSDISSTDSTQLDAQNPNNLNTTQNPLGLITESSSSKSTSISTLENINDTLDCPPLTGNMDYLTQEEFISRLTDSCRYDRLIKPHTEEPLKVTMQIDLTHIESSTELLQFKSFILVQLCYRDNRLKYSQFSPNRTRIHGEGTLRNKIWVPHLIVRNERESTLMGPDGKDIYVEVSPDGSVVYSYRITVTFYCWMNLEKFPFDYQICSIVWASWAYNASNLELEWEANNPFQVATNLHLTEFVLDSKWTETYEVTKPFAGGLGGNYSACAFTFKLRREVGYYIMDYFLPSIMLVAASWVSFWLQADAGPPRAILGASTMLSFITLNGGLSKNLPKVSYIKASEIWFLACSSFIFLSLAEFAFVNVIWRRKKKVELKKQSGKHILKGAITPSLARKQLRKSESLNSRIYKTRSCSSLDSDKINEKVNTQNNYLTVHSFPSIQIPTIKTQSHDELIDMEDNVTTIPIPERNSVESLPPGPTWTTMTPQEVAIWIDKKSRIVFPVTFLVFNLFYWSFVYAL